MRTCTRQQTIERQRLPSGLAALVAWLREAPPTLAPSGPVGSLAIAEPSHHERSPAPTKQTARRRKYQSGESTS